jgi:transcriptional regulator with XRE-family HTH domain
MPALPPSSSSSAQAAREALARRLRSIRQDAGFRTASAFARAAGWDRTRVSHIERGARWPSAEDIRTWARLCGLGVQQVGELLDELRSARTMWSQWREVEKAGLGKAAAGMLPLYERTRQFRAYSSWLLPGMVQTPEYARAILTAIRRRRGLGDDVEAALAARAERTELLRRSGKTFAFLVEESVLRSGLGGPEVMTAQLSHLTRVAALPSVSLGIVPATPDRGRAWPVEDFWIFDSGLVMVELVSGQLSITVPQEIAMYTQVFSELAGQAVFGRAARELIGTVRASL